MSDEPKVPVIKPVLQLGKTDQLPKPVPKEGWGTVVSAGTMMPSKKWHYFVDHRALCGRWMRFGDDDLEQGNDDSVDNCAECKRRLAKLRQQRYNKEIRNQEAKSELYSRDGH